MTHPNDEELAGAALVQRGPITELSQETKERLEQARQFVAVVGAIGGMSWGQGLTPGIRKAIAEYCRVYDVDPLTELDVLGGSFYVNSEWFLRKLGDMMRRGEIAEFWLEHIHADRRLREVMEDPEAPASVREQAATLWYSAKMKRAIQNAPENAEAICVAYIKLPGNPRPVTGCKWGGNGTSIMQPRRGGGAGPNPIVESNAALSVESQAIRRAVRQVSSHVGSRLPDFDQMDKDLSALGSRAETVLARQEEVNERLELEAKGGPKALGAQSFVGYAETVKASDAVPVPREQAVAEAQRAINSNLDPYGFEKAPDGVALMPPGMELREPTPIILDPDGSPAGTASAVECPECTRAVRRGHPEDHAATCSKYAD